MRNVGVCYAVEAGLRAVAGVHFLTHEDGRAGSARSRVRVLVIRRLLWSPMRSAKATALDGLDRFFHEP